jgi:hypothetical protein
VIFLVLKKSSSRRNIVFRVGSKSIGAEVFLGKDPFLSGAPLSVLRNILFPEVALDLCNVVCLCISSADKSSVAKLEFLTGAPSARVSGFFPRPIVKAEGGPLYRGGEVGEIDFFDLSPIVGSVFALCLAWASRGDKTILSSDDLLLFVLLISNTVKSSQFRTAAVTGFRVSNEIGATFVTSSA